jgi:superoxide dismutase
MWVEVHFQDLYSKKFYSYKYNLAIEPRAGDLMLVKVRDTFKIVECEKVHKGTTPSIATQPILAILNKEYWEQAWYQQYKTKAIFKPG